MGFVSLASRHWPFANGSGRIIDTFAKEIDLGSGPRTVQTSDGFALQVLADDLIGRHILLSGKFDRSIVQILLNHAKSGDVLLDIGANIGYVSACFLARIPNSKALCVEPQPEISDLLCKNMAQFGDRADVMPFGLAESEGVLRFHVDTVNRGASRIAEDGEMHIPVREAGKVLQSLPRVDIIKIDVEGYEEPIFRSMARQIKRLKPRAILFEDQTGAASPDGKLGSLLPDYCIYGIHKRLTATKLVPVKSKSDCKFNDYLALR